MEGEKSLQTHSPSLSISSESNASHFNSESGPQNHTHTPELVHSNQNDVPDETIAHYSQMMGGTPANHSSVGNANGDDEPVPPKFEGRPGEQVDGFGRKSFNLGPRYQEQTGDSRQDFRAQSPSLSTASASSSNAHKRSMTISKGHNVSVILIATALETIASSKEARRSTALRDSTQRALELIRSNQGGDLPREIFEPLRLACETRNEKLMIASLDCISKLISYSFFNDNEESSSYALPSPPASPHATGRTNAGASQASIPQPSLVDLVAHTITSCHTETTPDPVSLQIVKALLSLVLSPTILVHHSSLLKAVRTVYNIFLLSTDPVNQMVAQGGLTQMVHHVFTRCRRGNVKSQTEIYRTQGDLGSQSSSNREPLLFSESELKRRSLNEQTNHASIEEESSTATLEQHIETPGLDAAVSEHPPSNLYVNCLLVKPCHLHQHHRQGFEPRNSLDALQEAGHDSYQLTLDDLFVKDAFLVFRALCKLTMKPLNNERLVTPFTTCF